MTQSNRIIIAARLGLRPITGKASARLTGYIVSADKPPKRLTAQEAMERTKIRFEKTLAYLA